MHNLTIDTTRVSSITINEDYALQRIDNFLFNIYKDVPKSHVYKIIRKGEIRVNKGRVQASYKLQAKDVLRLPPIKASKNASRDSSMIASSRQGASATERNNIAYTEIPANKKIKIQESIENNILFEDDGLLILNKPSGLAVHGGSGINLGLIELLRAIRPKEQALELVHRLDRDTSGCILIAKKRSVLRDLHEQLRAGTVKKTYHTLVFGAPKDAFTIDAPLKKNSLSSGERIVRVDNNNGANAITNFKVIAKYKTEMCALLEAMPITGKTHQIRVHATHAGHPIALDQKYGDKGFDAAMKKLGLKRLFLHARELEFYYHRTKKTISITADYDANLSLVIKKLEALR